MDKILRLDYRSLTLFRKIIALIFLYKVCFLKLIFFDYFSIENGPFNNDVLSIIQNKPLLVSFITSDFQLIALLCVSILVGINLFLGIFPSLSAFAALIFTIVINRRFFPYFDGSDQVLVSILFSLFVLYIAYPKVENQIISFKTNPFILTLLVQLSAIYFFNGINKTHSTWWQGQAVEITLINVLINKPFAVFLTKFPILTTSLTYATLLFEILFPILIFTPYKNSLFRIVASILLIVFHWGISIFVDVSFYKYYGLAFAVLLLPQSFWEYFSFKGFARIKILFNINFNIKYMKVFALFISIFIVFKSLSSSIFRQNEVYKVFENKAFINFIKSNQFKSLSPLQQSWIMFAPSPPLTFGYIGFEYFNKVDSSYDNINIYGNDILSKNYYNLHPVHSCLSLQFMKVEKGHVSNESQFVLFNLFEYEVNRDIKKHPQRKIEEYQLVMYRQTYEDFKKNNIYNFERSVIASYE